MFALRLQDHQIDDVDDTYFQVRTMLAEQANRRQGLERRYVAGAAHHDVGFLSVVVAGPLPDSDAGRAMPNRLVNCQVLERWLLPRDDDVDVIATAQDVVG